MSTGNLSFLPFGIFSVPPKVGDFNRVCLHFYLCVRNVMGWHGNALENVHTCFLVSHMHACLRGPDTANRVAYDGGKGNRVS